LSRGLSEISLAWGGQRIEPFEIGLVSPLLPSGFPSSEFPPFDVILFPSPPLFVGCSVSLGQCQVSRLLDPFVLAALVCIFIAPCGVVWVGSHFLFPRFFGGLPT